MKHPEFESETFFEQGETDQGRWQARHYRQQTDQGWRESHVYAQSSGNAKNSEIITETTIQDTIVFQVSPDGTVTITQPSFSTHSYSSVRSSF
jgi:hypothetical protein